MMKALILKRYGKSDQLTFADISPPVIKPDEMLVQVHAAGLNPIDNMIPKGTFKAILKLTLPATMGSDVAGVVVEVGSRVTRFKPGDAVFASIFDLGTGALAEFAVVPENAAAIKPRFRASSVYPNGRAHVLASPQRAGKSQAWSESIHTCGFWRDRHVRDSARKTSRRKGGNNNQHG